MAVIVIVVIAVISTFFIVKHMNNKNIISNVEKIYDTNI